MRAGLRAVLFVVATIVLGAAAYEAWVRLVVFRGDCEPYSCGWPGRITWDAPEAVLAVWLLIACGVVWLVGRLVRRPTGS
jgi:hypothetical protein